MKFSYQENTVLFASTNLLNDMQMPVCVCVPYVLYYHSGIREKIFAVLLSSPFKEMCNNVKNKKAKPAKCLRENAFT